MREAAKGEVWLQRAATRLAERGYAYDPWRRRDDELFGFCKRLGDVEAVVQFQRHGGGSDEFTINLIRSASAANARRGARLGHVLWFVYQRRTYPQPDQWWRPAELDAVLDELLQFGLPWLEDEAAPQPWEMPAHRADEFAAAVQRVAAAELAAAGYRFEIAALVGGVPYPYFSRAVSDGVYHLIEFQIVYDLDPGRFTFDVRLQHKAMPDPLDFDGSYEAWRSVSLGLLAWRAAHRAGDVAAAEAADTLWHYTTRAELDAALRDAVAQINRLALPWLATAGAGAELLQ